MAAAAEHCCLCHVHYVRRCFPCSYLVQFLGEPYINQCDYDAAGDSLQWLYRNTLTPPDTQFARAMGAAAVGGAVQATTLCAVAPASVPMGKKSANRSFAASQVQPCADDVTAAALNLAVPPSLGGRSLRAGASSASGSRSSAGAVALAAPSKKIAAAPILRAGNGSLYEFNQGLFVDGGGWDSAFGLAQMAYVYIPDACLASSPAGAAPAGGCLLHAVFHGCEQTLDDIGHTFMTGSNYIPWAQVSECSDTCVPNGSILLAVELCGCRFLDVFAVLFLGCLTSVCNTGHAMPCHAMPCDVTPCHLLVALPPSLLQANNMVLLFPQAISNVLNPKGCFDWWGFTGAAYASNWGAQPLVFKRVMDVLMGNAITPNRTATAAGVGSMELDMARLASISKQNA